MKQIGIVLSQPPSYSETFFNSKIKGLQDSGYTVTLFVQQNRSGYTSCKVIEAPKVYRSKLRLLLSFIGVFFSLLPYRLRVFRYMRLERAAGIGFGQVLKHIYIHAHLLRSTLDWLHFGFATMALESEHVAKAIGAKMAVSCRGYDLDVYPLKYPKAYRLLWTHTDKVHAISNYMLQRAYATGLPSTTPSAIIPPAVLVPELGPSKGLISSPVQITSIARLHWIKGLSDTLEALALLKQDGLQFHYRIIGEGPELASLKFAVHQLGLTDEVVFCGRLAHDAAMRVLEHSSIYIQYSYSEGFCNAVLEAQVRGCLCVVSDGGALPENVIDEQTGWVVEKRNASALAKRLLEVIHLPEAEQHRIRQAAIERVTTRFNLKDQHQAFLAFYE